MQIDQIRIVAIMNTNFQYWQYILHGFSKISRLTRPVQKLHLYLYVSLAVFFGSFTVGISNEAFFQTFGRSKKICVQHIVLYWAIDSSSNYVSQQKARKQCFYLQVLQLRLCFSVGRHCSAFSKLSDLNWDRTTQFWFQ